MGSGISFLLSGLFLSCLEAGMDLDKVGIAHPVDRKDQPSMPLAVGFLELPSPHAFSVGVCNGIHHQDLPRMRDEGQLAVRPRICFYGNGQIVFQ